MFRDKCKTKKCEQKNKTNVKRKHELNIQRITEQYVGDTHKWTNAQQIKPNQETVTADSDLQYDTCIYTIYFSSLGYEILRHIFGFNYKTLDF